MRKTLGVSLLVLLLTGSAVAGDMPNDAPAPPPTAPAVQETTDTEQEPAAPGEIQNDAPGSLTQTMLDLLALLPSLL